MIYERYVSQPNDSLIYHQMMGQTIGRLSSCNGFLESLKGDQPFPFFQMCEIGCCLNQHIYPSRRVRDLEYLVYKTCTSACVGDKRVVCSNTGVVYEEILKNPLTEKWNEIFMGEWKAMDKHGHLDDLPTKLNE